MDLPDSRTLFIIFQVSVAIAIPAFVFFAVTIGRRRDRQRHAALARIAAELGMHFTPEDYTVLREFGGFPYRPQGDAPRTYSVMRGDSSGVSLLLFDYDVTIGSTNSRSIVRQTVAAFDLTDSPLPSFYVEGGRQEAVTRLLDKVFGEERVQGCWQQCGCRTPSLPARGPRAPDAANLEAEFEWPLVGDVVVQRVADGCGVQDVCAAGHSGDGADAGLVPRTYELPSRWCHTAWKPARSG